MKAGIVGSGIMGRVLAYFLVNSGWSVTLFDKESPSQQNNCSMVAAGLLSPIIELEHSTSFIFDLGRESLFQHWPMLIEQLPEKIYFQNKGSILLSHPRDQAEMSRFIKSIANKINQKTVFYEITQSEIFTKEPELSQFNNGYYFPDEGQIDNQTLMRALYHYLIEKNVTWKQQQVESLEPGKINYSSKYENFDVVFDCRGLGAKDTMPTLRGIRGELIWVQANEVNINHPIRLLHPRYKLYISPRPNNLYILGASEIESEDNSPISVRTTLELLSAAYYLHPGFAEARIINSLTHSRPTLTNHLPIIQHTQGFIAINGLYRHGYLLAPSLAFDVMKYLSSGISSISYPLIWENA